MITLLERYRYYLVGLLIVLGGAYLLVSVNNTLGQTTAYLVGLYLLGAAYIGYNKGRSKRLQTPSKKSIKDLRKQAVSLQKEVIQERDKAASLTSQMQPTDFTEVV